MSEQELQVLLTRAVEQNNDLQEALQEKGYRVVPFSLIETQPCVLNEAACAAIEQLQQGQFSWLVFSSANGVRYFAKHAEHVGARSAHTAVAVQGEKTAETFEALFKRPVDFIPSLAVSDVFAKEFVTRLSAKDSVLLVSARKTRGVLQKEIGASSAACTCIAVYETRACQYSPLACQVFTENTTSVVPVFSPSAFNAFRQLPVEDGLLRACVLVSVGPITSAAIRAAGFRVGVEARQQSVAGVVAAIEQALH